MKASDSPLYVVTADQTGSRRSPDAVPAALAALDGVDVVLPFERTTGDELQGLVATADAAVVALLRLVRLGGWHVGIGAGAVEEPLPGSTRAARGPAYVAAREAVEAAKRERAGVAVRGAGEDAETATMLLATLAGQRSAQGWEVAELLASGRSGRKIADELGVTPSAVSQRARRAHVEEVARASDLAARLLAMDVDTPARATGGPTRGTGR